MDKIVILGAGHVGSHCAQALAVGGVGREIVLVDVDEAKARAQAADVSDALTFAAHAPTVRAGAHAECADAALVVVAIGEPRRPGQTRLDLLGRSVEMLGVLAGQLKACVPACPVVVITNPADIAADTLRRALGLGRAQCFSTGTLLDTARLTRILSAVTGVARASIEAFALGEHGDSATAALSCARAGGLPLAHYGIDRDAVLRAMRESGMDIVRGKGSTEFGIGQALCTLARCILRDEKRVLPVSALLCGEYGQSGVHAGVPCRIGAGGVEEIVQLPLSELEAREFAHSCDVIRAHIERAK